MSGRSEEFDAQLAERGDDRPGLDDLEENDYSALTLDGEDEDEDDDLEDEDDDLEDEDDDDLDEDDEDDEDDDYPEDAVDEEIDLVAALYREDGVPAAQAMAKELANDFDELIAQLRRVPGDAGAVGVVIIDSDFFVLVRVRGKKVEVLLSDIAAAADWPIARDAADFLGEDVPDDDEDEGGPVGDFDLFADSGVSEFVLEQLCADLDADPYDTVEAIARKLGLAAPLKKVAAGFDL